MGAMVSQITSLAIVYSTVYSGADQLTGEFPVQMASNAENVSIWWRHHVSRGMKIIVHLQTLAVSIWLLIHVDVEVAPCL